jgi:hypothetical protein
MSPNRHAFLRQEAYLDAVLRAMRTRLRAGVESSKDGDPVSFAACEVDELELRLGARSCAAAGVPMPMLWLQDRLELTASEELVVWVLLAHELDPTSRQLMRDLNTERVADPTLDTLRRAIYGNSYVRPGLELAAGAPLRRMSLIVRTDGDERCPEHRQTFALSRRILSLALGDGGLDPSLSEITSLPTTTPSREKLVVSPETLQRVGDAMSMASGLVVLSGRTGEGRRSLLLATAQERGVGVILIDGRALSKARDGAEQQLQHVARECRLLRRVPLICHLDALAAGGEVPDRIEIVERTLSGLVLGTATNPIVRRWQRPPILIEMLPPTGTERAALWSRAIPEASDGDAELMATVYPLAPALIVAAGEVAHRQAAGQALHPKHIAAGVRSVLDDRLAGRATRVNVTQSWDDLVLPDDQSTALAELLARIRQRTTVYETWGFADKVGRGLGVSALFSGPPGTGKTMAAGLIAKDLRAELYQVDLSKIASKWIGETEKNLADLFDAAEAGHAILLFDEADALFGKRTDVKSSNDRHANQEVNFLLQRMESFAGVCILTTNHDAAIDEAFRRRLSVHVRFPVPDVDERRHLWRAMLPESAPTSEKLDFTSLAQTFVMSGGYIRNAVLRAAFLAADTNGRINEALLTRAAQLEYEAMGKVMTTCVRP